MVRTAAREDGQLRNAVASWLLILVLAATGVEGLLRGASLWAGFAATVVGVALLPAVLARDPEELVAAEVLAVSALPAVAQLLDVFWQPLGYLSVAALAVLIVAEIHAFSSAEMAPWFAALFVVLTTLSVAAAWGMAEYASDVVFGTAYLASGTQFMWDLVAAAGVGIAAGVTFAWYCGGQGSIREVVDGS